MNEIVQKRLQILQKWTKSVTKFTMLREKWTEKATKEKNRNGHKGSKTKQTQTD